MDVAAQFVAVVAHDQRHLAVRLQADHPVHDVDAGPLELACPLDVVRFVEARLELDEDGDLDTALGSTDQTADDRTVTTGAVERHLDRLDLGVDGSLRDERLNAGREALVRMVDHHGPMSHDVEDRTVGLLGGKDPSGGDRRPRLVFEVGALEIEELPQEAQVERCPMKRDVVHREFEFADEQFEHFGADVVGHLETHGLVEPAAAELHLDGFEEIVGLLLFQGEVGVSTDPERRPVLDDHPDEQPVELGGDQLLDGEVSTRRHRHQAREEFGDLQPCEATVAGFRVGDVDRQREGEVGDVGKRMPGIDGQWGEHREDAFVEPIVELDQFLGR